MSQFKQSMNRSDDMSPNTLHFTAGRRNRKNGNWIGREGKRKNWIFKEEVDGRENFNAKSGINETEYEFFFCKLEMKVLKREITFAHQETISARGHSRGQAFSSLPWEKMRQCNKLTSSAYLDRSVVLLAALPIHGNLRQDSAREMDI